MSYYNRYVLAPLLDRAMVHPRLHGCRTEALKQACGRTLEIGFGSGANLPFYPPRVTDLEVVEPDGDLSARALPRIAATGMKVDVTPGRAEALPHPDRSFDTVVSSLTLCSVDDPAACLREIRRVLKPGGQFLFLEHGLCPGRAVARWQQRLSRINACLCGGCRLDRDIAALMQDSGFPGIEMRSFLLAGVPRIGGYMTLGRAVEAEVRGWSNLPPASERRAMAA